MKWKPQILQHLWSSQSECRLTIRLIFIGNSVNKVGNQTLIYSITYYIYRSDRKAPNLGTFYYRHLDTDSEQELQKKSIEESEIKTSESSDEEWTYSTTTQKEVKKTEMPVYLAERANLEEIKALVENVNWSVSKNKHSSSNIKNRHFRHESIDPEVIVLF